jgi:uncharacterized protein (TIGR00288 family)
MAEVSALAVFVDFENLALGLQGRKDRFDIQRVLRRLVEKGKIIVKKGYADWSRYSDYKRSLHEAGLELIEIPRRVMTGKNSADIHLVVDAMDLSYSKEHIDTFVIVSGDSDFSPLVAKLKENGKRVLGLAMRNSTSELLVSSCDEFIFYEDLEADEVQEKAELEKVAPGGKRDVFRIVLETLVALQREISGPILASMIKDTIRRKQPSFSESSYGYRTFSALLEDAQAAGLLRLSTDPRSGTYVVTDFKDVGTPRAPSRRGGRRRSARRPSGRDEGSPNHVANGVFAASDSHPAPEFDPGSESPGASRRPPAGHAEPAASSGGRRRPRRRRSRSTSPNPL